VHLNVKIAIRTYQYFCLFDNIHFWSEFWTKLPFKGKKLNETCSVVFTLVHFISKDGKSMYENDKVKQY